METESATHDAAVVASPVRRELPGKASRRVSTGSIMTAPPHRVDSRGVSQDEDDGETLVTRRASRRRASDGGARVTFSEYVDEAPPRFVRTRERARSEDEWSGDDSSRTESNPVRDQQASTKRRQVVHWTRREEQFVIDGVKQYGPGQWRKILEDGQGIFHRQRTNVDIKDKWKNLVRRASLTAEEEERADNRNWRETVAAREVGRILQAAENDAVGSDGGDGEDDGAGSGTTKKRRLSHSTESIEFIVSTDAATRNVRAVKIVPRDCPTVSTLKRVLSRRLLGGKQLPANLQLISTKTRRLLGDFESVEDCAEQDGCDLYLLYDP